MEPGTIIADKFRVERVIGKGGMGTVVVAMHLQLEQRVALKFLNDELANQPAIVERFLREARSSARLRSEYVCKVLDVAQLDTGAPYIVMECLEGEDLGRLVARSPIGVSTAADFVVQACVAIAEAHAAGIVHRDLKPSNLFLTHRLDGAALVKVLDFGIAKAPGQESRITQTASLMGSPAYMSPEQLRSAKDVDVRSDVWSLGVILYELVSGRLPFPGDSITEVAVKVSIDPAIPLNVDPAFDAVVMRAIEKDIAKRYQSVSELANALAPFGGAQARALAAVIAKLLGGSKSAIEEVSRSAAAPPPDPRGFLETQVPTPTKVTTLGAAASSTDMPAKKSRTGLAVGLGLVGALAIGGGVFFVVSHGGGDEPAKPTTVAETKPIDAAPAAPVVIAPDAAVVIDKLAAERKEVLELYTQHQWREMTTVGLGSDDPEVGKKIAEVEALLEKNLSIAVRAEAAHDCAKIKELAALGNDPELTESLDRCLKGGKQPVKPPTTPQPPVQPPPTKAEVGPINSEARDKLATDPKAALALAQRVTASFPQNGAAWAIVISANCALGQAAAAKAAYASFAATQHVRVFIGFEKICAEHQIVLHDAETPPPRRRRD